MVKRSTIRLFQRVFSKRYSSNTKIVYFDGGLGSQILAYIQYFYLLKQHVKVVCNTDYYISEEEYSNKDNLFKHRKWGLDYYGIKITDLDLAKKKASYLEKFKFENKRQETLKNVFRFMNYDNELISLFPISGSSIDQMRRIGVSEHCEYALIHVRRGDYKVLATKLVEDEDITNLLLKIAKILPSQIMFLSDDPFSETFKRLISDLFGGHQISFIGPEANQYLAHALMRNANLLITSNSTFSISAALLQKKGGFAILPKDFASPKFEYINNTFQELSNWMVMVR